MLRRFFLLENGYVCMGPTVAQKGDVVVFLFGGTVPFALRPVGDKYLLLGECYVHGNMNGEFEDRMRRAGDFVGSSEIFRLA